MRPAALEGLRAFSAAIGRDPEQVQAAGGNTSLKADGRLWVKASGLWLKDAETREVFVPVDRAAVLAGIEAGADDPVKPAVVDDMNPEGLRPSIETTLHALLPHAAVVHTHSVRTLALAIRADAEAALAPRLEGLAWTFVPYCKPGLPLTQAVARRTAGERVDVLVLGNHGLVVGAETVDDAAALLRSVEARLDAPKRSFDTSSSNTLAAIGAGLGLRPVKHARAHGLAVGVLNLRVAAAGSYYPDHVIFLGPAAAVLPPDTKEALAAVAAAAARGTRLFLVPGAGALLAADAGESADELALCLALTLARVAEDAPLRRLSPANEAELLDWDAEKYRQGLAR